MNADMTRRRLWPSGVFYVENQHRMCKPRADATPKALGYAGKQLATPLSYSISSPSAQVRSGGSCAGPLQTQHQFFS